MPLFLALTYAGFLGLFRSLGGQVVLEKVDAIVYLATFYLFYAQYFFLFTTFAGATPGMQLCGLTIVRLDGSLPDTRQLLWRSFGYLLSGATMMLGFVWSLWDEDRFTWQDRISQTYVTAATPVMEAQRIPGGPHAATSLRAQVIFNIRLPGMAHRRVAARRTSASLVVSFRGGVEDHFEILGGPCADVLNVVLVTRGDECGRARAEVRDLAGDGDLQPAFADEEQHFLRMAMGVVRGTSWQQKYFVDVNAVSVVRQAIEYRAKRCVRLLLGDEVFEPIGRRLQRCWRGAGLRNQQETDEGQNQIFSHCGEFLL